MSTSKNNKRRFLQRSSLVAIAIPRDDALSFAVPQHGEDNHTFYLSNETAALQEPDAKIALVYVEEGCNTLELDDGEKHVGILGEWSFDGQITHKFTCLDDFAPEGHSVFMRSVTRKAE